MPTYSIDVAYACAQLGLDPGAAFEEIEAVAANAAAYRFSTRARVERMRRLAEFFTARRIFGAPEDSFAEIRKAYYRQAMTLHPDRNPDSRQAEEQLKTINAAYASVDEIYREARDYFGQSEEDRRESEEEARRMAELEAPAAGKPRHAGDSRAETSDEAPADPAPPRKSSGNAAQPTHQAAAPGEKKYMAASIPRFVRNARLSYLPARCVIGSWFIKRENDINLVYDVIMLPAAEFARARAYLGTPDAAQPSLGRGGFSPPYIPQDTKQVTVPPDQPNPDHFAKTHFRQAFAKEYKVLT